MLALEVKVTKRLLVAGVLRETVGGSGGVEAAWKPRLACDDQGERGAVGVGDEEFRASNVTGRMAGHVERLRRKERFLRAGHMVVGDGGDIKLR